VHNPAPLIARAKYWFIFPPRLGIPNGAALR